MVELLLTTSPHPSSTHAHHPNVAQGLEVAHITSSLHLKFSTPMLPRVHPFSRNLRIASTIPPNTVKRGTRETKTCRGEDERKGKETQENETKTETHPHLTRYAPKINTILGLAAYDRTHYAEGVGAESEWEVGDDLSLHSGFGFMMVF